MHGDDVVLAIAQACAACPGNLYGRYADQEAFLDR